MIDRLSPRALACLLGSLGIAVLGVTYVSLAGSAVVVDETDGVATAAIVTGIGREQPLYQLWRGYFYAIPKLEGTIELRCRDGSRERSGYVTRYMDTKIRVTGNQPCAKVVETN